MHNIRINERANTEISGVESVLSFDETSVIMQTSAGILSVDGEGLNVKKLDLEGGEVILDGKVNALYYPMGESKKTSLFSKIFG